MGIGQIKARLEVCKKCDRYVRRSGWNWYRCDECGVDENGHATQDLDSAFRDGPESNCLLGKWKGVVGLSDEEWAARDKEQQELMLNEWIERMDPFFERLSDEETSAALDDTVAAGHMPQEKCDEIKAALLAAAQKEIAREP